MDLHKIAKSKGWSQEDFPEWGNNPLYLKTIQGGYLSSGERPKDMYRRLAKTAANYHKDPSLEEKFYKILWNGWLVPSTPVAANFGTERGLPISCFSGHVGDDMFELNRKCTEMSILSKYGGGTAYHFSDIRPIGSPIKKGLNGTSDGVIPFIKGFDSWIIASKQGQMRRGAVAVYLNAKHEEYKDFLEVREPKGDVNRQCMNIHQGSIFEDDYMDGVFKGNKEREGFTNTIKKRVKTGEPYVLYKGNIDRKVPQWWKDKGLEVRHSNLCSEILLPTDENHTLVCCLSSLNLVKYDEWKDTGTIFLSIMFLDAVIEEFIEKAEGIKGIEDAVRFAKKSRALGLGTLGWHTYLQSKMIPFASIQATALTRQIFSSIRRNAELATEHLFEINGAPEWCEGQKRRNLTLLAIAPNRSSSKLAGGVSQGIEPLAANVYMDDDSKGLHIRRNPILEKLLEEKELNTPEIWDQISEDKGSVQNIKQLTKEEREVFLTFKEINQLELIRQAAVRDEFLDQGQSLNLAFFQDAPAKWILKVHLEAYKLGIRSLYYLRSESNLRADSSRQRDLYSECLMCEG